MEETFILHARVKNRLHKNKSARSAAQGNLVWKLKCIRQQQSETVLHLLWCPKDRSHGEVDRGGEDVLQQDNSDSGGATATQLKSPTVWTRELTDPEKSLKKKNMCMNVNEWSRARGVT